jgi:hypothetical protein
MKKAWLPVTLLSLCLALDLCNPTCTPSATAGNEHALLAQLGGASYAVQVAGDVILVGVGPNLYVLPEVHPAWTPCSRLRVPDIVRGITAQGSYAYVAAGSAGLRIVALSDPCSPSEVASVPVTGTAASVAVSDGYAYLAAGTLGVAVIDVRNPARPILSHWLPLTGEAQRITVAGQFAYVAAGHGALRVLSLEDSAHPKEVGAYLQVYEALDVDVVGDHAYLAAGEDGLKILSLQDPEQPELVTSQAIGEGFAAGVAVRTDSSGHGTYAYLAALEGGVRVISVHDPNAPREMDPISLAGLPADLLLQGPQMYVAAGPGGTVVVDLEASASPELIASFGILSDARDVSRLGSYYIVATGVLGAQSVSWHDDQLRVTGTIDLPGEAVRLVASGTNVYIAARDGGLCVLSAHDPARLVLDVCLTGPGPANGIAVQDGLAYVACDTAGLWIVDVSTPGSLLPVTVVDTPGQAMQLALMQGHAVIADGDRGLRVIAVGEPDEAREVGQHFETPGHGSGISVVGNNAYLADGGEGLHVISMVDPLRPEILGTQPLPGFAFDVQVLDSLAFVAAERAGLQIISAVLLELPTVRNSVSLPGAATGLYVDPPDGPVFVAARDAGLLVVDASPGARIHLPVVARLEALGTSWGEGHLQVSTDTD